MKKRGKKLHAEIVIHSREQKSSTMNYNIEKEKMGRGHARGKDA